MSGADVVVKIGGSLLGHAEHLEGTLAAVAAAGRTRRLLVVPGGGPFADAVRDADRRLKLSDDAAHWMAVLAMNQYAHLLASRLSGSALADDLAGIAAAFASGRMPVLAPYRWLRDADPLPHSWSVTSDSIAAWVAGQIQAPRLLLIKSPGAGENGVDDYFKRAASGPVLVTVLGADRRQELQAALAG
jgi:aspartokinase-like uncharacterized kinase